MRLARRFGLAHCLWSLVLLIALGMLAPVRGNARPQIGKARPPNIVLVLADDMGFSDARCYGSEIATPNLDRLANDGLRFTQFYNAARCCPTRAALLTGLYPHEAGVGHMTGDLTRFGPAYSPGLNNRSATIADVLKPAGYRSYLVGKWHVGGFAKGQEHNHPLARGFDRFYGTVGGGDFFDPKPLFLDREPQKPGPDYYFTDAVTDQSIRFLDEHARANKESPFFLHVCYTAPHFPLQAKPADIAKYRGRYAEGWDRLRERRFARQKELGIVEERWKLSPRDPVARPWSEAEDKTEWDLRMAVHAAMVDCMDQGIGRILDAVRRMGAEENTLVMFLSDNGASAEFLDSWPDPARGHRPGAETGTPDSHRCIEIGWANAANTPFRENKMWVHEGGISTPLIARWPRGISARGKRTAQVGHVIDLMPTLLEAAGVPYPSTLSERPLSPVSGKSLAPVFAGKPIGPRSLYWEHEGNRAVRSGDWKLVAPYRGPWELYNMSADRTETNNLSASMPDRAKALAIEWQTWADRVGVVPWEKLPGGSYEPRPGYRKKSEPVK